MVRKQLDLLGRGVETGRFYCLHGLGQDLFQDGQIVAMKRGGLPFLKLCAEPPRPACYLKSLKDVIWIM